MTTREDRNAKGKYGKWSQASMQSAIPNIKDGISDINEAARVHNVPKAILLRHLNYSNKYAAGGLKYMGDLCPCFT